MPGTCLPAWTTIPGRDQEEGGRPAFSGHGGTTELTPHSEPMAVVMPASPGNAPEPSESSWIVAFGKTSCASPAYSGEPPLPALPPDTTTWVASGKVAAVAASAVLALTKPLWWMTTPLP